MQKNQEKLMSQFSEKLQTDRQTDWLTDGTEFRGLSRRTWVQKDESINNKINFVQKPYFFSYDCKNLVPSSFFRVMNIHPTFKVINTPNLFLWTLNFSQ